MLRFSLRLFSLLVASGLIAIASRGAALPFTLANSEGDWRIIEIAKPLNIGAKLDAIVLSSTTEARCMVISMVDDPTDGENLLAYARRIKNSLRPGQKIAATEKEDEKFGHRGSALTFAMDDGKEGLICELFTFAHASRRWALLFLIKRDEAQKIPDPFQIFRAAETTPTDVVALAPFKVKDNAVTSFPISFNIKTAGAHVGQITVTEVPPGSSTDLAGVREGDEVLMINGKKVGEYASGLGKNSELGRVFLNRASGDEVSLQIISTGDKKPRTVVLSVPRIVPLSAFSGRD